MKYVLVVDVASNDEPLTQEDMAALGIKLISAPIPLPENDIEMHECCHCNTQTNHIFVQFGTGRQQRPIYGWQCIDCGRNNHRLF